MTATVRLDNTLENTLDRLSTVLHKKKSDIIREAISFYAKSIEKDKKSRIINAIEKTRNIDQEEIKNFQVTFNDGI